MLINYTAFNRLLSSCSPARAGMIGKRGGNALRLHPRLVPLTRSTSPRYAWEDNVASGSGFVFPCEAGEIANCVVG